jgi:hypothetical protein
MARYSLILKDSDFVILVQKAQKLGLSFGKLVNIILHESTLQTDDLNLQPKACFICGKKPAIQVRDFFGTPLDLCTFHSGLKKYFVNWKEVDCHAMEKET